MAPSLSLNYNSQGRNGPLGMGWSLGGLSKITRCAQTFAQDGVSYVGGVNNSSTDRLCIDGQRLVAVSGTYGADGTVYRFERDNFTKVVENGAIQGAGTFFTAYMKSGQILEYGKASVNDAGTPVPTNAQPLLQCAVTPCSNASVAIEWELDKVSNTAGDFYYIVYTAQNAANVVLLATINYTGHGTTPTYNSISFVYANVSPSVNGWSYYQGGGRIGSATVLSSIYADSGTTINGGTATTVSRYKLGYQTSPNTSREQLISVAKCPATGACLSPTNFSWPAAPANGPRSFTGPTINGTVDAPSQQQTGFCANPQYGDFNGDGLTDQMCGGARIRTSMVEIAFASPPQFPGPGPFGTFSAPKGYQPTTAPDNQSNCGTTFVATLLMGDFDGDGMTDLICNQYTDGNGTSVGHFILKSNGDGTFKTISTTFITSTGSSSTTWCDSPDDIIPGDFNGDGRTDLLCQAADGKLVVALSNGDGSFSLGPTVATWCDAAGLQTGDFNGDGKLDLICFGDSVNGHLYQQIVDISNGDGSFTQATSDWQPAFCDSSQHIQLGDFNGDGKADMVCDTVAGTHQVALSTGNGTFDVFAPWNNSGSYWCASATVVTGDFNGDGRTDLACIASNGNVAVALSDGSGGFNLPLPNYIMYGWCAPGGTTNGIVGTGDFNGDGVTDLLCANTNGTAPQFEVALAVDPPDMITSVTSGLGAVDTISYGQSGESGSMNFKGANKGYPSLTSPFGVPVVSSTTTDTGTGGSYGQWYSFSGPATDLTGRGFEGFQSVSVSDFCNATRTNMMTTTVYNQEQPQNSGQDWPLIGTVKSQTKQHYEGYCFSETADTNPVSRTINTYQYTTTVGKSQFLYLGSSAQSAWELNGTLTSTLTTNNFFDTNGNLTQLDKISTEGWVSTTCYTYDATHTGNWMSSLGLLTKTQDSGVIAGTTPDCTVPSTRTTGYTPDFTTGLVLEQTVEPGSTRNLVTTDYTRDTFGNILTTTVTGSNFATRTTTAHYETNGRFPTWIKNAGMSQATYTSYNPRYGGLDSTTDLNGVITAWTYDTFGRKLTRTVTDSTGNTLPTTTWTYNSGTGCVSGGVPVCFVQQATPVTPGTSTPTVVPTVATFYDILERPNFSTSPTFDGTGMIVSNLTAYDGLGRVASVTRPYSSSGKTYATIYTYDDLGRVLTQINPDGGEVAHVYRTSLISGSSPAAYYGTDAATLSDTNSPTSFTARTTTTTANSLGQAVSVLTPLTGGNPSTYAYDPFGNLTSATDSLGNVSSLTYDVRGHKTAESDPDKGNWTFTYDGLGEMLSRKDATLATVNFAYDVLGRPTAETGAVTPNSTWTYDNATCNGIGKLDTAITGTGVGTTSRNECYDTFGRPNVTNTTVDIAAPYTTTTSYDSSGRLYTSTYPSGIVVAHYYNAQGYLKSVNSGGMALWTPNTENDALQVTQETYGNGVYTAETYDPQSGRVTNIQPTSAAATMIRHFAYNWDVAGNLTTRSDWNHAAENFTYDTLNRLTGESQVSGGVGNVPTKTYSYSQIGNIATKSDVGTYHYGAGTAGPHALTSITGTTNDGRGGSAGLVTNPTYGYDADGRMTSGGGRTYSYTGFEAPATIANAGGTVTFTFDADHNRVKQATPSGTTVYIVAQGVRTEIFTPPACSPTPCTTPPPTYNSYVTAGDQLIDVMQNSGPATAITHTYLHSDHLGSTMLLTDGSGGAIKHLSYDPWGKRRNLDGSDDPNDTLTSPVNRGFTGQEELADSYLVDMNARIYDPQIGKFGSGDPLDGGPAGAGDWNRYAYVGNNPLNRTDPTGMNCFINGQPVDGCEDFEISDDPNSDHIVSFVGRDSNGSLVLHDSGPGGCWDFSCAGQDSGLGFQLASLSNSPVFQGGGAASSANSKSDQRQSQSTQLAQLIIPIPRPVPPPPIIQNQDGSNQDNGPPPSTPTGQSGSPMNVQPGTNAPATIDGIPYSGHAQDEMQSDGITPTAVEDALDTGQQYPSSKDPNAVISYSPENNISVVKDINTGTIITVTRGRSR